jgi:hypothetical protein
VAGRFFTLSCARPDFPLSPAGQEQAMSVIRLYIGDLHPMWSPLSEGGAFFNDESSHLVIGIGNPNSDEVDAFQGLCRFGLMKHQRISIITLKFGESFTISTPYHASAIYRSGLPEPLLVGERQRLSLYLVDAETGEIVSMRASSINPRLTKALHHQISQQKENPISAEEFGRDAKDWISMFPSPAVTFRASTWCYLGD